jgi:hypothetical protein
MSGETPMSLPGCHNRFGLWNWVSLSVKGTLHLRSGWRQWHRSLGAARCWAGGHNSFGIGENVTSPSTPQPRKSQIANTGRGVLFPTPSLCDPQAAFRTAVSPFAQSC